MQGRAIPPHHGFIAEDITLFLVLTVVSNTILGLFLLPAPFQFPALFEQSVWQVALIHIAGSIYCGHFTRTRTILWMIFIACFSLAGPITFLEYVLPMGQISFWLAARITNHAPSMAPWFGSHLDSPAAFVAATHQIVFIFEIITVIAMGIDLFLAHARRWRVASGIRFFLLLCGALITGMTLSLILTSLLPAPEIINAPDIVLQTPSHIVPEWNTLPLYAILRSVTDKTTGVALMLAVLPALIFAPWMRGEIKRISGIRHLWLLSCLAFYATWIGLTYCGSLPPSENVILCSQLLAGYYFCFLFMVPLLAAFKRQDSSRPT